MLISPISYFRSMIVLLLCTLLSYTIAFSSEIKEIDLYNVRAGKYHIARNYDLILKKGHLKEGQLLNIEEHQFRFVKILGSGYTTMVMEVEVVNPKGYAGTYALRLPKQARPERLQSGSFINFGQFISDIIKGYIPLEKHNINIPKYFFGKENVFAIFEVIKFDFKMTQFFQDPNSIDSNINLDKVRKKLLEFAQSTYLFEEIGDLHPGQLLYSNKKDQVILLDWFADHTQIKSFFDNKTVFHGRFEEFMNYSLDRDYDINIDRSRVMTLEESQLLKELKNIVLEKRKKRVLEVFSYLDKIANKTSKSIFSNLFGSKSFTKTFKVKENEEAIYANTIKLWLNKQDFSTFDEDTIIKLMKLSDSHRSSNNIILDTIYNKLTSAQKNKDQILALIEQANIKENTSKIIGPHNWKEHQGQSLEEKLVVPAAASKESCISLFSKLFN